MVFKYVLQPPYTKNFKIGKIYRCPVAVSLFLGGVEMLAGYNSESVFNYLSLPFGFSGGLVGAVAGIPVSLALGTFAYFKY